MLQVCVFPQLIFRKVIRRLRRNLEPAYKRRTLSFFLRNRQDRAPSDRHCRGETNHDVSEGLFKSVRRLWLPLDSQSEQQQRLLLGLRASDERFSEAHYEDAGQAVAKSPICRLRGR